MLVVCKHWYPGGIDQYLPTGATVVMWIEPSRVGSVAGGAVEGIVGAADLVSGTWQGVE